MGIKFTEDQEKAINEKGNILVAAAAGSGKTAVLVERVIRNIIEKKINIDEMLVVTFTKAAASEMKEKIMDAVYKKVEEDKNNLHLKKQLIYIGNAKISTIHSFCFNIIKENFYNLSISPSVKVGKSEELEILKNEAIDEVFEEEYEKETIEFKNYISKYAGYRDDKSAKEMILTVQNFLNTIPFYEDFLEEIKNVLLENVFFESKMFKEFFLEIKEEIAEKKEALKKALKILENEKINVDGKNLDNLNKNISKIMTDIKFIENLERENNWDNISSIFELDFLNIFERWTSDKTKNENIAISKQIRDSVKEYLKELKTKIFFRTKKEILEENEDIKNTIEEILDLSKKYEAKYTFKKNEGKILDFADLEKLVLKLLIRKPEKNELEKENKENIIGKYIKTDIAKKISKRFKEIQIDEYQDINTMQEYILNSISSENVFQVGDIKQSIYMFRNANPNLFLSKYIDYGTILDGKTIKLFKNFRSRNEVLKYTNEIFEEVMTKKLGGIKYDKSEYLNLGFPYKQNNNNYLPELVYIETKKENIDEENFEDEEKEILEELKNIEYEAIYIKNKIDEIIKNKLIIYDKNLNIYRSVEYRDIVVLLRSTKNKADIIENILSEGGIPVYTEESSGYLNSVDVNKIISYLKIIDNPSLDIDLLSILRSYFWHFSLNDITKIIISVEEFLNNNIYTNVKQDVKEIKNKYLEIKDLSIYEKMKIYLNIPNINKNDEIYIKVDKFISSIKKYKKEIKYIGISKVLYKLIYESGYIKYIIFEPAGKIKKANLDLFLQKAREYETDGNSSLKRFVDYIEKIKIDLDDTESASVIGEDENVVRIMTMHKSKGLEYPVVFLANMNKKINEMDLKSEIMFDEKLGIALNHIDTNTNFKSSSLLKEIFINKKKNDIVSEELRILYVALTRAREKLYILGTVKDYKKYIEDLENDSLEYINSFKLSEDLIKKRSSFLDIITLVNIKRKKDKNKQNVAYEEKTYIEKIVDVNNLDLTSVLNEDKRQQDLKEKINALEKLENNLDEKTKKYLDYIFNEKKENIDDIENKEENKEDKKIEFLKKMSVSKISYEAKDKINYERPKILSEGKLTGKERGDLIHNIFKNIDFRKKWDKLCINNYIINEISSELKYNKVERENIDISIFENFVMSDMYRRIRAAKEIKKEENFYFLASKSEIENIVLNKKIKKEEVQDEKILIQGIIDLYFVEENEKIVLIDYKTDNPYKKENLENQLVENYSNQLKIYSLILEKAYNKKVSEIYIYSTTLNKFIKI